MSPSCCHSAHSFHFMSEVSAELPWPRVTGHWASKRKVSEEQRRLQLQCQLCPPTMPRMPSQEMFCPVDRLLSLVLLLIQFKQVRCPKTYLYAFKTFPFSSVTRLYQGAASQDRSHFCLVPSGMCTAGHQGTDRDRQKHKSFF